MITLTGEDLDGEALGYELVELPSHGEFILDGNELTYTPSPNWHGEDSFSYRVSDGKLNSTSAVVSITIKPLNDAPTAMSQSVELDEDTSQLIPLAGEDLDGDALSYELVELASQGELVINGDAVAYVPLPNWHGEDSFSFRVSDGELGSALAVVTVSYTHLTLPTSDLV